MTINTKACIFEPPLSLKERDLVIGPFVFDGGIGLSSRGAQWLSAVGNFG